jgi:hypothetical protein
LIPAGPVKQATTIAAVDKVVFVGLAAGNVAVAADNGAAGGLEGSEKHVRKCRGPVPRCVEEEQRTAAHNL